MKKIVFSVLAFSLFSLFGLTGFAAPFIPHTEPGPFGSYLAMNLEVEKYAALASDVSRRSSQPLKTRGEAHITVITPIEYFNVLKKHLSIEEINKIALESGIQEAAFTEICLGRGQKVLNGINQSTYYVVVRSPALVELRRKIAAAFVAAGGDVSAFIPTEFFPHITVGFTERDLHFEDGVIKDDRGCIQANVL